MEQIAMSIINDTDITINEKLVVKHNKLIEFKGKLTVNEIKLLSLIIADVRVTKQHEQFKEYRVDISYLKDNTNHKDFYNYLKETALRLESRRIVVERINGKNARETTLLRLINKPRITDDTYELEVYIDKDLIPYITDLKKNLTSYQIENILRLKSSYSIRIYELLKQFEATGEREVSVQQLREFLGIAEEEYKRFYDFERWVLKAAKEEINKFTDILIDYEKIKVGRSIDSIKFSIKANPENDYSEHIKLIYDIPLLSE